MEQEEKLGQLAVRPVGRLLWEYSLPAVIGMLVMALYNVVDRIFIGQWVGPEGIAGLAITFPVMNLTTAVGVLVGVGSSARISIVLGAGKRKRLNCSLATLLP
ncbi:MAG: MATE family efflux transporter, partial [Muribaculaceae bacterium]|nr:MATE family efflux transporter [Muribaculaceae bacterium]